MEYRKGNHSKTYTEIPAVNPGFAWHDGMVSGNGLNGYITSGSPYNDVFIFQYMLLNFPSNDPREIPAELTGQLDEARRNVFNLNDRWEIKDTNGGKRKRTYYYSYHPGHQLRLKADGGSITDYIRWTNHETAETGVKYTDDNGEWRRVSFTSRADNVTITKITQSSTGNKINMVVYIDDIMDMNNEPDKRKNAVEQLTYSITADKNAEYIALTAKYPSYPNSELKNGGYAGVTRVICENGNKELVDGNKIKISDAAAVYLISEMTRTHDVINHDIFAELLASTMNVRNKYTVNGVFDYNTVLECSAKIHGDIYNRVSFNLGNDDGHRAMDNGELIAVQKNMKTSLNQGFIEKVYAQGRYAQICCSGHSAPRLGGMWTGDWQPRWRAIYTLDANVNLQVSAMNTGCMKEMAYGYITFFLRNAADFGLNAAAAYGMTDAIQVSVNSDGDRAMHVEYDNDYPFQYWNAGASWCLLPIYEYWQCFGNERIPMNDYMRAEDVNGNGYLDLERDILLPLLTKQANFWEQLCIPEYYISADGTACYQEGKIKLDSGETYMLIPCYSPENHPLGYKSTITANATMDISAARDGLKMVIDLEKAVKRDGYEDAVKKWESLASKLTAYKIDSDGALCEWAVKEYSERNNHRHISHLYPAWPAYETRSDPELAKAAVKAVDNRNEFNITDATAGHGWMHKALVEARLKRGEGVANSLLPMASGNGYYNSLMTDHDTNRKTNTFCTDTLFGALGAVHEALVYSNTGEIELLPALPADWVKGSISGIAARCRAVIKHLEWDKDGRRVSAEIISLENDNNINVSCGIDWVSVIIDDDMYGNANKVIKMVLRENQKCVLIFNL
jgi:hypothetical protein